MNVMDRQAALSRIDQVIAQGPFSDDWESLSHVRVPAWFRQGKFGIFIHWGVYSVPAFGSEWYPRNMYMQGSPEFEHHQKTYGAHKDFGYKDFIPMFRAEKFDPNAWAALFARAGARYVVPVAEHHDGFQMYGSDLSEWNAVEKGPCRDVLGELSAAFTRRGLLCGASSHRAEHWFFMGHGKEFDSDVKEPLACGDFYWPAMPEGDHHDLYSQPAPGTAYLEDWLLRCCEMVDRYRPRLFYFDWWIQHVSFKPYLKKFAAYYYNRAAQWGEEVMINYKHEAFMFGTAVLDIERGQLAQAKPYAWQTDTAIAKNSWCYTENNNFKKAKDILCDLMDIVSKNGSLLLNVGPKADGTISPEDTAVLEEIGDWLAVNGEAVYDTRCWRKSGEGPTRIEEGQFTDGKDKVFTREDFRFTCKGDALYATCLAYPADGRVCISSLSIADASHLPVFAGIVRDVKVLGFDGPLSWTRTQRGLEVETQGLESDKPVVLRVTLD